MLAPKLTETMFGARLEVVAPAQFILASPTTTSLEKALNEMTKCSASGKGEIQLILPAIALI